MSVERLGLIVVEMLVLLVLVLFVAAAMVCGLPLLEERGWLRTTLEGLSGEPRGCEVLLSEALDRILRSMDGP